MLSPSVTLTCVIVTVACVASAGRDSPRTLALDWKSESHSAVSPGRSGGISVGGAAGSNVWLTKTVGCLLMVGNAASPACPRGDRFPRPCHDSQPNTSTTIKPPTTSKRRKFKPTSALHSPDNPSPEPRVCPSKCRERHPASPSKHYLCLFT